MFEFNNKIRILFFISSMILSVYGLEISILNVLSDFKCKTKIINKAFVGGNKYYVETALKSYYYEAFYQKTTVIAYIVDETRFEEIACPDALGIRMNIGLELGRNNHEIVVLGIENCQDNDFDLISEFLGGIIKPHPNRTAFEIVTMGEECFDRIFGFVTHPFGKYKENSQIYNGTLQEHIRRSFPKMAYRSKRPDSSNIKEVRFFENKNCRRKYSNESRWPILVQNGEYIPASNNFNRQEHNFLRRNRNMNVHILVVSGKDYIRLTTKNQYPVPWFEEIQTIMKKMKINNEMLYIMGCFNFDWSEIGLVSQIILTHSKVPEKSVHNVFNVFTAGMGMFDTSFHNPSKDDERKLQQSSNDDLMEFIERYQGQVHSETMQKRSIEIYNFNAANVTTYEIVLSNGRYERRNHHLTSQYLNARFAFIVIDSTEMNNQNVFSVAQTNPYVRMLQSNGIELFVIKLNNFKLYDLHIVPEWIESIRGAVPPNRIALFGAGSCNTIFQFVSPEYQITYTPHTVAHEFKEVRNGFVATADDKRIILANINVPDFWIQIVPMHTNNGFYDPVVISEIDMIPTAGNTGILFLIMNADKFINMLNAVPKWRPTLITEFRQRIENDYPLSQWMVYLVGLHNFAEKDFHLFAEFVKSFTNDSRPLREFVYTFGDGIYQANYEYRDTLPFYTAMDMPMADAFTEFFHAINVISVVNEE